MNSVLRKVFALIGSLGIVGPHSGHEAELLLSKKKPIGYLTVSTRPDELLSPDLKKEKGDLIRLDAAVSLGNLRKCIVVIPPSLPSDYELTAHFYCQPQFEAEMHEVANFHEAFWTSNQLLPLSKPIGRFLGYTDRDIKLFRQGGYDSFSVIVRQLMEITHPYRKAARLASMRPLEFDP